MDYEALRTHLKSIDKTASDGLYAYVAYETTALFINWEDLEQMLADAEWGDLNS